MLRSVTQGARESGGFVRLLKQNQKVLKRPNLGFQGKQLSLLSPHPPVPSCPLYTIMGIWGVWDH